MTSDETPQDPYGGTPYYGPPPTQPGYGQQGYPQQYPPAYPQSGYPPGYGHPQQQAYGGYPGAYPYPPYLPYAVPGTGRPGTVTASAVLAFVGGGLLIAAALLLFAGASVLSDLSSSMNADTDSTTTEFTLAGVVNLVTAGLLIAGGVTILGRKGTGRTMISVGGAIVIVAAVYWLARYNNFGATAVYALLFSALAIISMALAFTSTARTWLAGGPAGRSAPG
jgi:hypothetical protein